jgi:peptide/nickel transport system substrate-binding protein
MQNRFGIKDLVLVVLMVVLIVAVFLQMKQNDRQFVVLQRISDKMDVQSRDLAHVNRELARGVTVARGGGGAATTRGAVSPGGSLLEEAADPFDHVKQAQTNPDYALGDWFIVNTGVRLPKLTPFTGTDLYSYWVDARVFETLAMRDPVSLEWKPLLAESWTISEDGLTITFRLRRGVSFADGSPFTADDVLFTYNWIMNPQVAAPRFRSYYERVGSVTKTGDYEVVFEYKEPYFESFLLAVDLPIIAEEFYGKMKPEDFNEHPGLLMGTGPYMAQDPKGWRPGQPIVLVRNERYWGEPGPFDRLVWTEIEQDSAEITTFKNGQIDYFEPTPEQFRQVKGDAEVMKTSQALEYAAVDNGYSYIGWNQRKEGKPTLFADKRVRRALTMLIDRQRMIDTIMYGSGMMTSGPFYPTNAQYDPSVQPWPYDPEGAKALLREAGFQDRNGDGVLESAAGEPFRFKFTYLGAQQLHTQIVLFVKDSFARAGIVVEPNPTDWSILLDSMDKRTYDAVTLAWTTSVESDLYQIMHSSQIKDNGDNNTSYSSPELDKVLEEARRTVDEKKRMPLWRRAHAIVHEDEPYTFLWARKERVMLAGRIKNVSESKLGLNYDQRYTMPIPWYVPKQMQKRGN